MWWTTRQEIAAISSLRPTVTSPEMYPGRSALSFLFRCNQVFSGNTFFPENVDIDFIHQRSIAFLQNLCRIQDWWTQGSTCPSGHQVYVINDFKEPLTIRLNSIAGYFPHLHNNLIPVTSRIEEMMEYKLSWDFCFSSSAHTHILVYANVSYNLLSMP